jgi:hypothetical protein
LHCGAYCDDLHAVIFRIIELRRQRSSDRSGSTHKREDETMKAKTIALAMMIGAGGAMPAFAPAFAQAVPGMDKAKDAAADKAMDAAKEKAMDSATEKGKEAAQEHGKEMIKDQMPGMGTPKVPGQ